jgi:hypothetical protein
MVLFLLGTGVPAWTDPAFDRWEFRTDLGYLQPQGGIGQTFGGGFNAGLTVGRQVVSTLVLEASVRFADMGYSNAATVNARECIPSRPAGVLCVAGPTTQRGALTALEMGVSVPLKADGPGRHFRVGAGGVLGHYSISPGGESLGSRDGPGYYLLMAVEPVPIGSVGRAGLVVRGSRIYTHGDSLGTSLPASAGDTWLDFNLSLRFGPEKGSRH